MAKRVNPAYILQKIKENCDEVIFTSGEAITRGAAQGIALGTVSLSSTDFTVATGDAAGDSEKITLSSQPITWSGTGTVSHAVFCDTGTGEFILCTTASVNKPVTATDTGTINSFDIWEIGVAT